jgi:mating pheromone alpha-factor
MRASILLVETAGLALCNYIEAHWSLLILLTLLTTGRKVRCLQGFFVSSKAWFKINTSLLNTHLLPSTPYQHLGRSFTRIKDSPDYTIRSRYFLIIMRFNALIAATILAVTVSGAALPTAEETTAEVASTVGIAPAEADFLPFEFEDFEFKKRDAEAKPWNWYPYRPYGTPSGKRSAEADAEAQPEAWNWRPYRPYGTPSGKRSADAEAWNWRPYRPYGTPSGKREE